MSLISFRTSGMTKSQHDDLSETFKYIAEVIGKLTERIDALESDVAKLKAEPRKSLAQKLREKK